LQQKWPKTAKFDKKEVKMAKDKIFSSIVKNRQEQYRKAKTSGLRRDLSKEIKANKTAWQKWFENEVVIGKTRVILDMNDNINPTRRNPVWQSIYSCYGTIINRIDLPKHLEPVYEVLWDNGEINRFRFTRLRVAGWDNVPPPPGVNTAGNAMHPDPNKGFLMKKNQEFLAKRKKPFPLRPVWAGKKVKDEF
jgi:hypothetical protein